MARLARSDRIDEHIEKSGLLPALQPEREQMSSPKIVEVIIHGPYKQISIIVDVAPNLIYKRIDNWFFANDGGWYGCLKLVPGSKDAFGGSKFSLPMEDGTAFECSGQVWSEWNAELCSEETRRVGVATMEQLANCYVFASGRVSLSQLEAWLANNEASTDYWKYDKRTLERKSMLEARKQ